MPTPTVKLNLGSSSFITTNGGYATEHLQYTCAEPAERMAYGEDFIHQQNTSNYYTPYTFSAKEKDAETGFGYFGARYYQADLSIWLSVDPLADKFPHQSPFMYCSGNPVMRVDPTGMSDEDFPPPNFEGLHWKDADGSFDRNAPNETYKWTKPDGSPGGAVSSEFNISSTRVDNAAQGGGGGLNTANDWLGYAGYAEGAIGAGQIGMLSFRQSLSISSKIGTFGSFSSTYRALGTTGKVLGGAGYLGAGLNTYLDYKSMQSGEIGAGRFGYRTAGTLGSIGGSIGIGAIYGGPWGAVGGAVIGGASWAGEKAYDGYMYWQTQMSIYLTNFENGLKSGWVPGR